MVAQNNSALLRKLRNHLLNFLMQDLASPNIKVQIHVVLALWMSKQVP